MSGVYTTHFFFFPNVCVVAVDRSIMGASPGTQLETSRLISFDDTSFILGCSVRQLRSYATLRPEIQFTQDDSQLQFCASKILDFIKQSEKEVSVKASRLLFRVVMGRLPLGNESIEMLHQTERASSIAKE